MKKQLFITKALLWTARISSTLIVFFILYFLITHLISNQGDGLNFLGVSEILTFLFFPISSILGLLIALRWELPGGIVTLLGMVGLLALRSDLLSNVLIMIPIIPAVLYILYFFLTRNEAIENS